MPKRESPSIPEKARTIAKQLRKIDWNEIEPSRMKNGEQRTKIIREFLKKQKIPHRSIFTIKRDKSTQNMVTIFDLNIRNKPEKKMEYEQARNELVIPVNRMLKILFPDSYNMTCDACNFCILNWNGFCPDFRVCENHFNRK